MNLLDFIHFFQHFFNLYRKAPGRVTDQYMGHSTHQFTILQDGAAAHALHDAAGLCDQIFIGDADSRTSSPDTLDRMVAVPVWISSAVAMGTGSFPA